MQEEKAVLEFLADQLKRREEERRRQEDQLLQAQRINLSLLLNTWRFVLVARIAFLAITMGALQYILQNIPAFIDTRRLVATIETIFGREIGFIKVIEPITSAQAANIVAVFVLMIVFVSSAIDVAGAMLQRQCTKRGVETEKFLGIQGVFHEALSNIRWILLPFHIARIGIGLIGLFAIWYLGVANQ